MRTLEKLLICQESGATRMDRPMQNHLTEMKLFNSAVLAKRYQSIWSYAQSFCLITKLSALKYQKFLATIGSQYAKSLQGRVTRDCVSIEGKMINAIICILESSGTQLPQLAFEKYWYPKIFTPIRDERLRYCTDCLLVGFHSWAFQLPWVRTCPVHGNLLLTGCISCGAVIKLKDSFGDVICKSCKWQPTTVANILKSEIRSKQSIKFSRLYWLILDIDTAYIPLESGRSMNWTSVTEKRSFKEYRKYVCESDAWDSYAGVNQAQVIAGIAHKEGLGNNLRPFNDELFIATQSIKCTDLCSVDIVSKGHSSAGIIPTDMRY